MILQLFKRQKLEKLSSGGWVDPCFVNGNGNFHWRSSAGWECLLTKLCSSPSMDERGSRHHPSSQMAPLPPEMWARGNILPEWVGVWLVTVYDSREIWWLSQDLPSYRGVGGRGNSVHVESYSLCYSTQQSLEKNRLWIRLWGWAPDSAPGKEPLLTGSLCFLGCEVENGETQVWW